MLITTIIHPSIHPSQSSLPSTKNDFVLFTHAITKNLFFLIGIIIIESSWKSRRCLCFSFSKTAKISFGTMKQQIENRIQIKNNEVCTSSSFFVFLVLYFVLFININYNRNEAYTFYQEQKITDNLIWQENVPYILYIHVACLCYFFTRHKNMSSNSILKMS